VCGTFALSYIELFRGV